MSESIKRGDRVRVAFEGEVSDVDTPGFGVTCVLENGQADYKWFGPKFIKDTGLTVEKIAPPKPDQPTGLGAVVEDENGETWVRCQNAQWRYLHYTRGYADIAAVRVLSEGVTA